MCVDKISQVQVFTFTLSVHCTNSVVKLEPRTKILKKKKLLTKMDEIFCGVKVEKSEISLHMEKFQISPHLSCLEISTRQIHKSHLMVLVTNMRYAKRSPMNIEWDIFKLNYNV